MNNTGNIIHSKVLVKQLTLHCLEHYHSGNLHAFYQSIHKTILQQKIKFPALEHASVILDEVIADGDKKQLIQALIDFDEIGSYVIAGKMLQISLNKNLPEAIESAGNYMIQGDVWYACDIIGERVMGHALLTMPDKTIPILHKLSNADNKWLVRSVGVATHYATKKGLSKVDVEKMFGILFLLSGSTEFHTKTGIGWGAKTVAKFHPDIIRKYQLEVESSPKTKQWFKTKIKIGLGRSEKYAGKHD